VIVKEQKRSLRHGASCTQKMPYLQSTLFLTALLLLFAAFAIPMGISNALNTMMNTAYRLLIDTVLYIMAIAVIASAFSALMREFGVIELLNKLLSPLMNPLYGMPGAAALGIATTYFSDNPAILTLADDPQYRKCFKTYQIPALTNLGTAFGMGLIVTTFMLGLKNGAGMHIGYAVLCGNLGTIIGSVLSTRLMLHFSAAAFGRDDPSFHIAPAAAPSIPHDDGAKLWLRFLNALMDGGRKGVQMGIGIIPGVLIICSAVMMLTNGASADGSYTGAAYEGIGLLPMVADKLSFLFNPLFGFSSSAGIAVPVTAMGSAGAALGLVPKLVAAGQANGNDIAVFTAMCMCWSGYLSTHVSMMDVLHYNQLTGKAILSHTFGGIAAGVAAHWLFQLILLLS
jgi:hypothetical protein